MKRMMHASYSSLRWKGQHLEKDTTAPSTLKLPFHKDHHPALLMLRCSTVLMAVVSHFLKMWVDIRRESRAPRLRASSIQPTSRFLILKSQMDYYGWITIVIQQVGRRRETRGMWSPSTTRCIMS